jgi:hypothetical protein
MSRQLPTQLAALDAAEEGSDLLPDELSDPELSDPESPELFEALESPPESDEGAPPFALGEEYRSLYQPLPFRWKDEREMSRSRDPPQVSQSDLGSSLIRCIYSKSLPQS